MTTDVLAKVRADAEMVPMCGCADPVCSRRIRLARAALVLVEQCEWHESEATTIRQRGKERDAMPDADVRTKGMVPFAVHFHEESAARIRAALAALTGVG